MAYGPQMRRNTLASWTLFVQPNSLIGLEVRSVTVNVVRMGLAAVLLLFLVVSVTDGSTSKESVNVVASAEAGDRDKVSASAIGRALADPSREGIVCAVRHDEIKTICQSWKRELVPASAGEYLTVVSPREPVPKSFRPNNLVSVTSKDLPVQKPIELKREASDSLIRMAKLINSHKRPNGASCRLVAVSGYRSPSYQSALFERKVNSILNANPRLSKAEAQKQAAKVVAPPYESEHALGTTVDFTTGSQISKGGDILTNDIGNTEEYALMMKEAWRFGWVNSLMPGKEHLTGRMTEQWHWRYVGAPHAEIMWSKGWVPEEYRDYMREQQSIAFRSSTGDLYWVHYDNAARRVLASVIVDRDSIASVEQEPGR